MEKRIRELQEKSGVLETTREEQAQINKAGNKFSENFYLSLSSQKAYKKHDPETIKEILNETLSEEGVGIDEILNFVESKVLPQGLNPASGNHFGYIPGGGLFSSAVGDYIAAVTNRYAGVFFASPGAVAMENRLIKWMSDMIGYPKGAGGYLASGGSMANLTAVHAAREEAGLKASDISNAVVYMSDQTHHCVDRALKICGLSECQKRHIPLDEKFRMKANELEKTIKKDKANGLIPWLIVASVGTTDMGAIDPLEEIGNIAHRQGIWYHVDAAYGGFFLLIREGKEKLKGISTADSVVLDPHKGLFLPYGSGALVVKNVDHLIKAHHFEANYMQDTTAERTLYSPADVSPELSKHFRALRLWFPLKLHGISAFRSALQEKLLLTRYAWNKLQQLEDIEVSPEPELTTFTFRWKPTLKSQNFDQINRKLHYSILEEGEIFLSTTQIKGKFWFRLTVLSVRTHLEEIDRFMTALHRNMEKVESEI
ncbi:MAG TPA: aminotransferase class V-fold PLP-dependent enzyme [Gracilimonas sp.]|uniref:pyridoxal phosphate-dependent decarboxylase family protein n=1 Tax=Gracilimonas sp. TaxID=1974203 RepID=UPI002D9D5BEE|nr:aminotransferase class V-fold PLP-dependent enzyme [Gracilimonas sp.]